MGALEIHSVVVGCGARPPLVQIQHLHASFLIDDSTGACTNRLNTCFSKLVTWSVSSSSGATGALRACAPASGRASVIRLNVVSAAQPDGTVPRGPKDGKTFYVTKSVTLLSRAFWPVPCPSRAVNHVLSSPGPLPVTSQCLGSSLPAFLRPRFRCFPRWL